jgi:prepilin-type processing-associated H-X9-DG protein
MTALLAILLPAFTSVREQGRQSLCSSNEKQLASAFLLYMNDNDNVFPSGKYVDIVGHRTVGWAGQIYPYIKNPAVFRCPDDPTNETTSYIYNQAFGFANDGSLGIGHGSWSGVPALGRFSEASITVLLVEGCEGPTFSLTDSTETSSPSGTGWDGFNLVDRAGYSTGHPPFSTTRYATGYLYGQTSNFDSPYLNGRHSNGSNVLLTDGHVLFLLGRQVSPGLAAAVPTDAPNPLSGNYNAAGTENLPAGVQVTFSPV